VTFITGQQAADQWYSEIERYDFTKHTGPQTGKQIYIGLQGNKDNTK